MGFVVFLIDWCKDKEWLKQYIEWDVPMLFVSFFLFLACSAVMIIVTLFKPHEHTEESAKLVWSSPAEALRGQAWKGIGNYKLVSVLLVITMVILYWIFN